MKLRRHPIFRREVRRVGLESAVLWTCCSDSKSRFARTSARRPNTRGLTELWQTGQGMKADWMVDSRGFGARMAALVSPKCEVPGVVKWQAVARALR